MFCGEHLLMYFPCYFLFHSKTIHRHFWRRLFFSESVNYWCTWICCYLGQRPEKLLGKMEARTVFFQEDQQHRLQLSQRPQPLRWRNPGSEPHWLYQRSDLNGVDAVCFNDSERWIRTESYLRGDVPCHWVRWRPAVNNRQVWHPHNIDDSGARPKQPQGKVGSYRMSVIPWDLKIGLQRRPQVADLF